MDDKGQVDQVIIKKEVVDDKHTEHVFFKPEAGERLQLDAGINVQLQEDEEGNKFFMLETFEDDDEEEDDPTVGTKEIIKIAERSKFMDNTEH